MQVVLGHMNTLQTTLSLHSAQKRSFIVQLILNIATLLITPAGGAGPAQMVACKQGRAWLKKKSNYVDAGTHDWSDPGNMRGTAGLYGSVFLLPYCPSLIAFQ